MALTSLWKMLCCSTWWSTSGRSVPKLWLLSLSWEGRVEKGVWARAGALQPALCALALLLPGPAEE